MTGSSLFFILQNFINLSSQGTQILNNEAQMLWELFTFCGHKYKRFLFQIRFHELWIGLDWNGKWKFHNSNDKTNFDQIFLSWLDLKTLHHKKHCWCLLSLKAKGNISSKVEKNSSHWSVEEMGFWSRFGWFGGCGQCECGGQPGCGEKKLGNQRCGIWVSFEVVGETCNSGDWVGWSGLGGVAEGLQTIDYPFNVTIFYYFILTTMDYFFIFA